ncbi:DUF4062 domain-containing protein [Planococcus sp. SIMBA_160]
MKKKLQVFVSSTFIDLVDERQAAVEAILSAGHIPAGMELFKAGDESQKETIKKWIDESDVYVLILGGRYGTIEPSSSKSYTHWEYDYAEEVGIPRFAIVITEDALERKSKINGGKDIYEFKNPQNYEKFKSQVLSKTSEFYGDLKDIKLTILRKLAELAANDSLSGWISAKDIQSNEVLINTVTKLLEENAILKEKNQSIMEIANKKSKVKTESSIELGYDIFERLDRILKVIRADEQDKYSEVSWLEDEDKDTGVSPEINLPRIPKDFKAYFINNMKDGTEIIEELLIVGVVDSFTSFNKLIADIRVMLGQHKSNAPKHSLNIKFIIVMEGKQPDRVIQAEKFFEKALATVDLTNEYYMMEVWDENKLEELERELVLIL